MARFYHWPPSLAIRSMGVLLLMAAATTSQPCEKQALLHARPAELGVTHVQLLGHVRNEESRRLENVIVHAFIKIAKMVSGTTALYGIGWVEGFEAGVALEFMPEHLPWLRHLPPFELWAIDSVGNDIEGPVPVNVSHGSVLDTLRMGFRMEATFQSPHELFQLRVVDWARRYALHTRNIARPGTLQPWYRFPDPSQTHRAADAATTGAATGQASLTPGWTPPYDMMLHTVSDLPGPSYQQTTDHPLDDSPLNTADDDDAMGATGGSWARSDRHQVAGRVRQRRQGSRMDAFWATRQRQLTQTPQGQQLGTAEDAALARPAQLQKPQQFGGVGDTAASRTLHASDRQTGKVAITRSLPEQDTDDTLPEDNTGAEADNNDDDESLLNVRRQLPDTPRVGPAPVVPAHVPLVVVMTLAFSPSTTPEAYVHYAQQFVRHTEYHLDTLGMQRVLVYIHEALYLVPAFHDYVARHLPAHLLPFVTFVVWNEFFMIKNPWYDQYVKYFHGVVALWGYGGALGALIDIDEYIAFPGAQTTLHEALQRCNATHLDWVRLTNQMIICDSCHQAYNALWKRTPAGGGDTDLRLWWEARDPRVHEGPQADAAHAQQVGCRWWKDDPLLRYTRTWNDYWFVKVGRVRPSEVGTVEAYAQFQGKHLIRGEAAVAFMHHRGELLPGKHEAWLDPNTCPYIAHLVHSNGFRPKRWGAKLAYFVHPIRHTNWFLLPQFQRQH